MSLEHIQPEASYNSGRPEMLDGLEQLERSELEQIIIELRAENNSLREENEGLRSHNTIDELTGLDNLRSYKQKRDAMISDVQASIEGGRENDRSRGMALINIDINHFKSVNDSFGHDVGDEVLKLVANTLKDSTRGRDIVSRNGGDEFRVILYAPNPNQAAHTVIKRIKETLSDLNNDPSYKIRGHKIEIGLACGAVVIDPHKNQGVGSSADELEHSADVAMYNDKHATHEDKQPKFVLR